jgi:hypothetical protein
MELVHVRGKRYSLMYDHKKLSDITRQQLVVVSHDTQWDCDFEYLGLRDTSVLRRRFSKKMNIVVFGICDQKPVCWRSKFWITNTNVEDKRLDVVQIGGVISLRTKTAELRPLNHQGLDKFRKLAWWLIKVVVGRRSTALWISLSLCSWEGPANLVYRSKSLCFCTAHTSSHVSSELCTFRGLHGHVYHRSCGHEVWNMVKNSQVTISHVLVCDTHIMGIST